MVEALGFSKTERRTFHETDYQLSIAGDNESISIEVEHVEDGRRWRAKFAARFIEEITQRTGNAKKFEVFVRMLLSALAQESDAVYLDVLTARDLEMLRRHANPQGPPTTSTAGQNDKRYMILTYRAEFDKVHYPLPLPLDEQSEEEMLKTMVSRLRQELAQAQTTISDLEQKVAASVAAAEAAVAAVPTKPSGDDELVGQLKRQNAQLGDELHSVRKEAEQLRAEMRLRMASAPSQPNSQAKDDEAHKLRSDLSRLKGEIKSLKDDARQKELAQKRTTDKLNLELKSERQKADRLQAQVRKLDEEKRTLGSRLQAASRAASAERSRPASRTPSAERAGSRPPSRPVSGTSRPTSNPRQPVPPRAASRASSVASSRERTPSPSSFLPGARGRQAPGPPPRGADLGRQGPQAMNRSGSPGLRGEERQSFSPGGTPTLSPYRRPSGPPGRTPSPGTRSRERTPSPGSRNVAPPAGAFNGAVNGAGNPRAGLTLRDRGVTGREKPMSSRYSGGSGNSRPSSASRSSGIRQANAATVASGLDAAEGQGRAAPSPPHEPGSLFGLAAHLGIGPHGSPGAGPAVAASVGGSSATEEPEACDIDARLQALQSFLKQTKNI